METIQKMAQLPAFIRFLEDEGLLVFDNLESENLESDTTVRIQKCAYLSRRFGLDLGYEYTIYQYGPYSPDMAEAYYDLLDDKDWRNKAGAPLPDGFDRAGFLRLVRDRDRRWLEIAVTLLDMRDIYSDDEKLIDHVECRKINYSHDYIDTVLRDLQAQNMCHSESAILNS